MPTRPRALFLIVCLFCLLFIELSECLSCGKCRTEECKPKLCQHGTVKDPCNCCAVCAKGPGEECGGPWDLNGKCAHNLTCTLSELPEGANFYFFRIGICLPVNLPPDSNDLMR